MIKKIIFFLAPLISGNLACAEGVSLGATRLIFPSSKTSVDLKIYNTDKKYSYVIQSWITDEHNRKSDELIVNFPLFVIKPESNSLLRVIHTGNKMAFPQDRERLFYLYSKMTPLLTKNTDNTLFISTTTKIKIFFRPDTINEDIVNPANNMKCNYESEKIKIRNASPYYMNLVSLSVGGVLLSKMETLPPMSAIYFKSGVKTGHLLYSFINDYGVQVKNQQCVF